MKSALIVLGALILLTLSGFSLYQFQKLERLSDDVSVLKTRLLTIEGEDTPIPSTSTVSSSCDENCKKQIEKEVAGAVAKISITPMVTVVQTSKTSTKQISFVPMGSGSTVATDWITIEDSAISLDLLSDYGANATVSWEASLKVANGNGTAYARLYDATHNIAVDGSEVKTDNNGFFENVTSKNLPFWRGRNIYKVQIKSLNGYETTISSAKLKIQY